MLNSNRQPEDAAFPADLTTSEQQCGNFLLLTTMTAISRSRVAWQGSTLPIDEALVARANE